MQFNTLLAAAASLLYLAKADDDLVPYSTVYWTSASPVTISQVGTVTEVVIVPKTYQTTIYEHEYLVFKSDGEMYTTDSV